MNRALAVLALLSIVRKERVSLPVLLGAMAADLILTPVVVANATSTSTKGSIACGALRP